MPKEKVRKEFITFSVDNLLLEELGRRLVPRDSSALSELIKNSYDADATKVSVVFENVSSPGGVVLVKDNGTGMTYETIRDGWMRIGTTIKKDANRSARYRRPRAGSKGVGRFACQRIAEGLKLETVSKSKRRTTRITASFPWDDFQPGKSVTDIPIAFEITEGISSDTPCGTELRLESVRNAWSKEIVETLRDDISSIVRATPWEEAVVRSDSAADDDPGMTVTIIAEEFGITGEIEPQIVKASWGYIEGRIQNDGKVKYEVHSKHLPKPVKLDSELELDDLGPTHFKLFMMVAKKEYLGSISRIRARELRRKFGGVRIFYDGFRVPPYGDADHDWLELDRKRGQRLVSFDSEIDPFVIKDSRPLLRRPGNTHLFGGVQLSRISNPNIEISTSRERINENASFSELCKFLGRGIDLLTVVYAATDKKKKPKEPAAAPLRRVSKKLDAVKTKMTALEKGEATVEDVYEILDSAKREVSKSYEIVRDRMSMYRVLASTGMITSVFAHEMNSFLNSLKRVLANLNTFISSLPEGGIRHSAIKDLDAWRDVADSQVDVIESMLGKESRFERSPVLVRDIARKLFKAYSRSLSDIGAKKPENHAGKGLRTPPMYLGEVYSIILNLLTNSLKALQKSKALRKIRIITKIEKGKYIIHFLDTGPGVPPELRKTVFQPFFSESEPDIDHGLGTGLGLNIIQDTLGDYEGTVEFIEPPDGWGACVQIIIPFEEGV